MKTILVASKPQLRIVVNSMDNIELDLLYDKLLKFRSSFRGDLSAEEKAALIKILLSVGLRNRENEIQEAVS